MTLRRTLRAAAAAVIAAAAVVLLPQAPVSAAACSGSTGITVIVDSNEIGAGISAACAPAGGTAEENFAQVGYRLERNSTGMICKINGLPEDGPCTESDSFWSLWWSDGRSGSWVFSSQGVGGLTVPDGGYVAFAWHKGGGQAAPPDVAPTPRVTQPSASASKHKNKSKPAAPKSTAPKPSPSPSATSASPTPSPSTTAPTPTPTQTPSDATSTAAPTDATTTTSAVPQIDEITAGPEATSADADDTDDGGFPAWLGIGLVIVVLGSAAAVPVLRRRRG